MLSSLPVPVRSGAQILLLEHRIEVVLFYLDVDHDPIEARSPHRHLPLLTGVFPGGRRPAVAPDPYAISYVQMAFIAQPPLDSLASEGLLSPKPRAYVNYVTYRLRKPYPER